MRKRETISQKKRAMTMINSRKPLIAEIAMMERTLQCQQANVIQHKKRLVDMVNDHRVVLIIALLPAFFWGWKKERERAGVGNFIIQLLRIGLLAAFTHVKNKLIIGNKK